MSNNTTKTENKPAYTLTLGRVKGAVFGRSAESGRMYYSARIEAFWRENGSGAWRTGSSFDAGDLGNLVAVAVACLGWIIVKGGSHE